MRLLNVYLLMLFGFPSLYKKKLVSVLFGIIIVVTVASVLVSYCINYTLGFRC